jgi:hypothetical protein
LPQLIAVEALLRVRFAEVNQKPPAFLKHEVNQSIML